LTKEDFGMGAQTDVNRFTLVCVWKNGNTSQMSEALETEKEAIELLKEQDETAEPDDLQSFRWNSYSPNVDYYMITKI
jgi:hypothetical protein